MWALVWLAIGVGLRQAAIASVGPDIREWEAGALLDAWAPQGLDADASFRPVGPGWLMAWWLSDVSETPGYDVAAARQASLWLQLLALGCAGLLVASLGGLLDMGSRSLGRGLCWMTAAWAVHPTLIASGVGISSEAVSGAACCLVLTALVLWRRVGWIAWSLLPVAFWLSAWAGGVVAASAVLAGLIVFVLPVPRLRTSFPLLSAVLLAGAGSVWLHQSESALMPALDTGPAHGVAQLAGRSLVQEPSDPVMPHALARHRYGQTLDVIAEEGPAAAIGGLVDRVLLDDLAPHRHAPSGVLGLPWVVQGVLELFIRGGLLLFAVAAWTRLKLDTESAWPRAGAVAGIVVLAGGCVAFGVGPHLFAPVDFVLLAVAGAGATGSRADGRSTRYLAFTLGGLLFCTLAVASLVSDPRQPRWSTSLMRTGTPGVEHVERLRALTPASTAGDLADAAMGLLAPSRPDLYHPRLALALAQSAVERSPQSPVALGVLVRAHMAVRQLEDARSSLARLRKESPSGDPRVADLQEQLQEQEARLAVISESP